MNQDEKRADELFFFSRDWLLLRELAPDAQAAPRHRLAWELLAGLRERSPAAGRLRRAGALLGHVDALECSGQNRAAQALWALLQHEWRWVQHSARTRRYLKARAAALGIANADAEIKAVQSAITAELLPLLHLKALLPKSAKEGEHHLRFLHTWRLGASASTAFVAIYDKYLRELTRLGRIPGPDVGENVAALLQTQDHQSLQYQGLLASYCALMKSVLDHVPPANRIEDLVRGFAQVQQAAPPRS